ncbi:hypothetical protein [Flavobacterium aquiphilum]|uniref:hypothetical protein n=1 Tax=Flavobacterium aquiphilum TaxID=3003261 RepID=UPI0024808680|nr:hypothetical protein [Flavobacterium aquiphilum]
MKITIISYDNWGLNNHLKNALTQNGHTVRHINFFEFKHKYPNFGSKLYNFLLKTVFNKNIKQTYYGKEILKKLAQNNEIQDVILTIKGDFIDPNCILEFKKFTKKSIAFFNDSITRCQKIKRVISSFDEVYSFEKNDCKKYNLHFITNWIYPIKAQNQSKVQFQVYNISSKDNRLIILSRIAEVLKTNNINYKIVIFDKKNKKQDKNLEYTKKPIPLVEVIDNLCNSKVLLDINRSGQNGLTFRVFESIGLEKKLITTNVDIKNYDFYNPNNILIIDEKKPHIPLAFFNSEYEKIPETISEKYTLEKWINQVFQ